MAIVKPDDFLQWDLSTLSQALKKGELSPVEVTEKTLERIHKVDKELNAYITILAEEALAEAKQAEKEITSGNIKGPLHGVPIALKDLVYTKGIKTTMGSDIYREFIPDYDAAVVERLKEAGAIIIGKLNTHQFAYSTTGDRSHHGPAKNPHDLSKMTGGSSSGSGAAVTASLCYGALGTDTGGSVRIPASFCGIVGMKPTFGQVSKYGTFPLCYTMDHIGPMTRTVKDNALMLNVLAAYDKRDPYSERKEKEDFTRFLDQGIEGTVIGVLSTTKYVNEEVRKSIDKAVETFKSLGAEIKMIDIPRLDEYLAAFRTILRSEAYAVHEQRLQDYPDQWDEEVKERLSTGAEEKATEYVRAQQIKLEAIREYDEILSTVDVLLTPTVPILPANIGERQIDVDGASVHISLLLNHFTGPTNLNGFPSISVPCGVSESGLPIGLQIVGKPFEEAKIYQFAAAFEGEYTKN